MYLTGLYIAYEAGSLYEQLGTFCAIKITISSFPLKDKTVQVWLTFARPHQLRKNVVGNFMFTTNILTVLRMVEKQ